MMYDVTAECSFTAVRNWMSSVQVRAAPRLALLALLPLPAPGLTPVRDRAVFGGPRGVLVALGRGIVEADVAGADCDGMGLVEGTTKPVAASVSMLW